MDSKARQLAGVIRRCISSRFILRSKNQEFHKLLLQYRTELEAYFLKMGVELILNEALGIAYLAPSSEWDEDIAYRLGRTRTLSAWETLALIFLRHKRMEFFTGTIESEAPWISRKELRDYLREYSQETEDRRFENQFAGVLKGLKEHQILLSQDDLQFEITPVCEVLLPADQIAVLKEKTKAYFEALGATAGAMSNGTTIMKEEAFHE